MEKQMEDTPTTRNETDLASKLAAYAKRLRDRPAIPVNPSLAQEELARRAAERREKVAAKTLSRQEQGRTRGRSPLPRLPRPRVGTVLSAAATAVLLAGAGAVYIGGYMETEQHESEMAEISVDRTLAEERAQVAALPVTTDDELTAQLADQLVDAREVGARTASLQNTMADQADLTAVSERTLAVRADLAELFAPETFLLDDDDVAGASTAALVAQLGDDRIDPRTTWYFRVEPDETLASPEPHTWTLANASVSPDRVNLVDVLWLCQSSDTGAVLAWARASYSAERGQFTSLQVANTAVGDFVEAPPYAVPDIAEEDANGATGGYHHDGPHAEGEEH